MNKIADSMIDPIIDEVNDAGEAYFAKFGFDLDAITADLQRRTEVARKAGREVLQPLVRREDVKAVAESAPRVGR